ncbi:hypothetical protein TNCV_2327211 [Trichonephila clavipes]|nr:hypothetical protein TNCV_2327211 [Trichonephila clavipes]
MRKHEIKCSSVKFDRSLVLWRSWLKRQICKDTSIQKTIMSRRKQRSAFDQVSEFNRGWIVAYRDCGLSLREIGSRDGRNQTTVMRMWAH